MNEFEQYKERLQQFDGIKEYKEKVVAIIEQKGFYSVKTKQALQNTVLRKNRKVYY